MQCVQHILGLRFHLLAFLVLIHVFFPLMSCIASHRDDSSFLQEPGHDPKRIQQGQIYRPKALALPIAIYPHSSVDGTGRPLYWHFCFPFIELLWCFILVFHIKFSRNL